MKLIYKYSEAPFRENTIKSVRDVFKEEIGKSICYKVYACFKSKNRSWIGPIPMIYDTGAIITLLPYRMLSLLNIEKYAIGELRGVIRECVLKVHFCKITLVIEDRYNNRSPEINAWAAIAYRDDVPFILGMKDFENLGFENNPKKKEFYLHF